MTIRRLRNKFSLRTQDSSLSQEGAPASSKREKRVAFRQSLIETLESRQLMAVGPRLIGVQPNNSDLIEDGVVRSIAPRELTFRFDDAQVIDAATVSGIRVTRAGGDGSFTLPSISTDFGTNGRVDIQLTSLNAGDVLSVEVRTRDSGATGQPEFAILGNVVSIVLNANPAGQITAQGLVNAINASSVVAPRMRASINGGIASTLLGAGSATSTPVPTSYSPITMLSSNDIVVQPGAVVIGDRPNENEVTLRFAENLPDDMYRLEVFGFDDAGRGIRGLRNTSGDFFVPSVVNTRQDTIDFRLDLGSKVTAVVPQPVVRNANGDLEQLRDTIVVYFDNDKLLVENDSNGNPTARSVENPEFYQLIYTADTVRNTDDLTPFLPVSVRYNASANTATLRFNDDIDLLPGQFLPSSTFRLRVGTRETTPLAPVQTEAAATAILDMNTNGAAKVRFTSRVLGEAGAGLSVQFVNSNTPNATVPTVSVVGSVITVDLQTATATVDDVITALETDPFSSALIRTTLEPGSNGAFVVGNRPINYQAVLFGLGSSFDTSTNLGTIGSSNVPLTSLLLTSSIDAELHRLDLLGATDDLGQRIVPEAFENHINPNFGADDFAGIRTLYYNFQTTYGTVAGQPVSNAITEKQKARVREALALWSQQLGVQFMETSNSGITFALGDISAAAAPGFQTAGVGSFRVRIDPAYQNSLAVFSANNLWEDNYGEDFTRTAAASIGLMLGLSFAGNLDPSNLMRLDTGFLTFPPTGSDRNFEPVFPGNQDVLQGQYIHRPEGSDIDLYRFDIDFGPGGQSREGVFVAETFAERAADSLLDTRLALYKEVQATTTSNLNAGQSVEVKFTAVAPGKLGNNLQIFVTRSPRGAGASPLVQVFPNAITIDLNSTVGSETTLDEFVRSINENLAARSLVKVELISGAGSTILGNREINYSPITLRGGRVDLISQNDNYFSKDSLIRMNLDSGVYYIGVSSSGNDQYDPVVAGTGTGGRTQGKYDLRLTFRAQTDSIDSIQDISGSNGDLSVPLDGDADGVAGGGYNFWFETRSLDRTFRFNAGGSSAIEDRIITLTGANNIVRRFQFSADTNIGVGNTRVPYTNSSTELDLATALVQAINSRSELGIVATASGNTVRLRGERLLQFSPDLTIVDVLGKTIFVDKAAGPNADGSLDAPFNNISRSGVPNAFGATFPGDIVRIVGNGGSDGLLETVGDNIAYEIGFGLLAGSILSDGPTMDVPKGVTVMIDAGAIFKSNRSRIGVGSSTLGIDRSGGALQVLGAPILLDTNGNAIKGANGVNAPGSVFFTSWLDESIGLDNYPSTTSPSAGNWGGLVFKRDLDLSAGRFDLEDEGIFRQYVNHADIRYGGSSAVVIDSIQQTVNAIQVADMRPTISFNRITNGADAAMSATPDSFQETLFSEPLYQRRGSFTPDYDRVGPEIHDNVLTNNSVNGLFVNVTTPAGGELKQLQVAGRFNDTDIVHVLSENVLITGQPGASTLDSTSIPSNLISMQARSGGALATGTYTYKVTFVDRYGYETSPSDPSQAVTVLPGESAVAIFGIPGVSGEYVARRLYRSDNTGGGSYRLVGQLDGSTGTFLDRGQTPADFNATLLRDRPNISGMGLTTLSGGTLATGGYTYRVVMIDEVGRESLASNATALTTTTAANRSIRLTNIPPVQEGFTGRRIYRSAVGGVGPFVLIAEITSNSVNSFIDTGANLTGTLSVESLGTLRPRLDASLAIDPGTIIKLEGARIELGHSAQLLAEGTVSGKVIFTSKQDDRFGAGGTFDTNNNGLNQANDSSPGDWSGIYASPGSTLNLDNAVFAYAGGVSRIEGSFKAFSPIELQQATSRIAHTTFENNANGIGGQGPIDRLGRPANENYPLGNNASRGSTVFVRGNQPVVLGNVFQNNAGSALTIDANSMDAVLRGDSGRQSGDIDRDLTLDANRGPLFRENQLFNNGINGLEIRGDYLSNNRDEAVLAIRDEQQNVLNIESVWDDTDIVHVLFDSITISNLEHSGGLRLQSAVNQSLVIKMEGQGSNFDQERGTGFTATGRFGSIENRVGGTIHVLGQPNYPVVFTSLRDDTVGAGTQPDGRPQTDTNNDGVATIPRPGDWRSLLFDSFSNDRNVKVAMEIEAPDVIAPGVNDNTIIAQFLGALAPNASTSDENLPLGYIVHGVLSEPADQDVYSFTATAGTEIWLDIDNTTASLDTVIELLNANGDLLARSDDSTEEQLTGAGILTTSLIDPNNVNPIIRRVTTSTRRNESGLLKDDYTFNEKDAGFRVLLPGVSGSSSTFFFRIRSRSTNTDNSVAGLTSGSYSVQLRLREMQEFAGSTVEFADIRYATNGVQANGLPTRSPLTGEAKVGMYDGSNDNITSLGSVHMTDLQAISVAGTLTAGATHRMRFNVGEVSFLSNPTAAVPGLIGNATPGATFPIVIDVDYADGLNRPNLRAQLFTLGGVLIADSATSNVIDDQPGPLRGSDLTDLRRGSVGTGDPFIRASLARGEYELVIFSDTIGGAGAYQVEIRDGDATSLLRGSESTSIQIPAALVIPDKSIVEMSDGANRIRFQFTYDGTFGFGNVPVAISGTSTPAQIATAFLNAVNSVFTQNRWKVSASIDATTASLVHLFGNVEIISGGNLFGANAILVFDGKGDVNVTRDQGQFTVTSSTFTNNRDYAVWSAPADKYYADGRARQPSTINGARNYFHPATLGGAYARNLPVLNEVPFGVTPASVAERAGMTPGMIVTNNVFDSNGLGGLHIQGETPLWRITAFPGTRDRSQNDNAEGDHSGWFIDDSDLLVVDFQRQTIAFEFEDIAGGAAGGPTFGSGVVGGNGTGANTIPIYYREDTGATYQRIPATSSGDATDDVIKSMHGSMIGSTLVTNGTTQRIESYIEAQVAPQFIGTDPADFSQYIWPTATLVLRGPQAVNYINVQGGGNPFNIQRVSEYTASPFVRAINNTIVGNDGRAPFNAQQVDTNTNDTIAGATETWQGVGINPQQYTVNGTLNPDPLSTGSSDVDLYKFHMEIGERVRINIDTIAGAGSLDSIMRLFDSNGVPQLVSTGLDPFVADNNAAPGENLSVDPYIDFTATVAGDYYVGVSAAGNDGYDPLSLADRKRGATGGAYRMVLEVLKANSFVMTIDDGASYAAGETFTISQVADFAGSTNNTRTFEFVFGTAAPGNGNIPVYIGPEYRTPDVARAIAAAINNADMNNIQNIANGAFGLANPLAPVSAIALGGENGFNPNFGLATLVTSPFGNSDVGINSGNARGAQLQAGLNRYIGSSNDFAPADLGNGHYGTGFGHDRTMSGVVLSGGPRTSLGNGTTEKYVVVRNAYSITSSAGRRIEGQIGSNNLNQILPESGILVSGGASPTLLNNVFVNVQTPIVQERPTVTSNGLTRPAVRPSAVIVGGSTYQYIEPAQPGSRLGVPIEVGPTNVPNTNSDFNFTASNTETLFVNTPGGNFLPAPGSRVIDSSIDSLPEREKFRTVKAAVGIAPSPILAPSRDRNAILRADDPAIAPPSGLGGSIFKDRGALDRADFVGPSAVTINPTDNDAQSVDTDPAISVMQLSSGVYPEFRIQLKDGFESANLGGGTGINDDSVTGRTGSNRLPGSAVTITENGRLLVEGVDYVFSYNTTTNEIILKPLAGVWRNDRVYDITLNNKDRFVIDAPSGDLIGDGSTFVVRDSSGGDVTFEYDSGYRLQIPQGIELVIPIAGGGAGGVTDGDTFIVNNGSQSLVFEFDSNGNGVVPVQFRVPFTSLSTKRQIADAVIAALTTVPGIQPLRLANDNVFVGAPLGAYVDTTDTPSMAQPNSTIALLIPALGTRPGGITDGQTFSVSDGRTAIVFEFDSDRVSTPGNTRIDISVASTASEVASAILAALSGSGLGISPILVGTDKVYLAMPNAGQVQLINTALSRIGISRALVDGQSITITRTVGATVTTRVFEFTTDAAVTGSNTPVVISTADTQSDIGLKLSDAINGSGLGLTSQHVGDGNIFIGGSAEYDISVSNAPSVGLFGRPGVQGNTTLDIFGTLLLSLPTRGGADIVDNSTFTISNNNRTVTFEFDGNFSGPSLPNNVVIRYGAASTAADLVTTMLPLITGAGLGITPRDAGNGRIDIGLLPNSSVNVLSSGITLSRGNVLDGDFFTINNGTVTVTFEFENLSVANGRDLSRVPIRYNNQSTRAEVFAAMKAAIESSTLGLQTQITTAGLRLLDNARYITNIDNAPSLSKTGVSGGAIAISFVQDASFDSSDMRDAIIRAINQANTAGRTTLAAKVRGGSTLFVENAISISSDVTSFFLRGISDVAGNFLKSNRINDETQFTILMPGVELDFGDAPDPVTTTPGRYPTIASDDGARHVSNATSLRLGTAITSETNGRPTELADGDSGDDGVRFQFQNLARPLFNRNVDNAVTVTLTETGFVDGWIDFNADGDWEDAGEHVIQNTEFTVGNLTKTFMVRVPSTSPVPATGINSFARFRTSTAGNHLPTGLALDGEVEDYLVRIIPGVPPVGANDSYSMDEDQVGGLVTVDPRGVLTPGFTVDDGVLANDSNPDGRPISARLVSFGGIPGNQLPGHQLVFSSDGLFTYIPEGNFFGPTTLVYRSYITVDAGLGEIIESASDTTVTINVRPVNDTPTGANFSRTIDEDFVLQLSESEVLVSANASAGPANESSQTMRVSLPNSVTAQAGSVSIVGGVLTYTPRADFSGVDTFTIRITDNGVTGTLPDPRFVIQTVTITVRDKNDAPITDSESISVNEDAFVENPISFFTDGDLVGPLPEQGVQTLTFSGVEALSAQGGSVTFVNGIVRYTPRANFNGIDTFVYFVTDNGTSENVPDPQTSRGTVTVTVNALPDAPINTVPLGTMRMNEDSAERSLALGSFFSDPDGDTLTYSVINNTNLGLVQINFLGNDMFVRPLADANGTAVITVEAKDSTNRTVTSILTVIVDPVEDTPRLLNPMPNLVLNEDINPAPISLSPAYFFDPDTVNSGDVLNYSVTVDNTDLLTAGVVNGQLQLLLKANASGVATITVRAFDLSGREVTDSFDVVVNAVNDGPESVGDAYAVPQGSTFTTSDPRGILTTTRNDDGVLANDQDREGNSFTVNRVVQQPTRGSLVLNPDGTFTYISNPSTPVGSIDTFTYEAIDQLGKEGNIATVTITIGNPPPPLHQNSANRFDVNADGNISPIDVLIVVNFINFAGSPSIPVSGLPAPPPYRDVDGDNVISPLDVLALVTYLNDRSNRGRGGSPEGEGESSQMVMASSAMPQLGWSETVGRVSPNVSVSMSEAVIATANPNRENVNLTISLADYLADLDEDEDMEQIATVLEDSSGETNESLDAFFAQTFPS